MPIKIVKAIIVSALGTFTLYLLGILLHGLIGSSWDLYSCAIGSFVATVFFITEGAVSFGGNLKNSMLIVFTTFIFISIGHVGEQFFVRKVAIDFEPVGKFFWATIATSWWLIPIAAWILSVLNRTIKTPTNERKADEDKLEKIHNL